MALRKKKKKVIYPKIASLNKHKGLVMENSLVEVIKLLLIGMGIVFTFIIIAVYMTKGKILRKLFPQEEQQSQTIVQPQTINVAIEANTVNTDLAKVAAIVAAIHHHNLTVNTDAAKIAAVIAAVQHHTNLKG